MKEPDLCACRSHAQRTCSVPCLEPSSASGPATLLPGASVGAAEGAGAANSVTGWLGCRSVGTTAAACRASGWSVSCSIGSIARGVTASALMATAAAGSLAAGVLLAFMRPAAHDSHECGGHGVCTLCWAVKQCTSGDVHGYQRCCARKHRTKVSSMKPAEGVCLMQLLMSMRSQAVL